MNIALPILLLIFGGLTFWLLTESSIKWYLKMACIVTFCLFTVVFWSTIHTFLGWPAIEKDIPETVLVHWVIVKEPDKSKSNKGRIYFLLESIETKRNFLLRLFGYKNFLTEPRLFGVPYSRELHEMVENQMRAKLMKGLPLVGSLSNKGKGKGKNTEKGGEGSKENGEGSESQSQEWQFHFLLPSEIQRKQ